MALTQMQGQSVSDSVKDTFVYITHVGLCSGVSVFGVVTNIFNMAVFWKQGFKESVTVSFFALSLCDLCVLVLFLWASVCLSPGFADHFDTSAFIHELHLVVGGSQRMTLLRLSVWITAFIAVERCVGTLRPHRVRQFFTPASSGVAIAVMAVLLSLSAIPVYTTVRIGTGFSRLTNSSRLMVTRVVSDMRVVSISTWIAGSLQLLSLIVILGSNMVLVLSLRRRSRQWQIRAIKAAIYVAQTSMLPQRDHQDASSDPHRSDSNGVGPGSATMDTPSLPRSATIETAFVRGSATIETPSVPGSATIETPSVHGSATIETTSVPRLTSARDSVPVGVAGPCGSLPHEPGSKLEIGHLGRDSVKRLKTLNVRRPGLTRTKCIMIDDPRPASGNQASASGRVYPESSRCNGADRTDRPGPRQQIICIAPMLPGSTHRPRINVSAHAPHAMNNQRLIKIVLILSGIALASCIPSLIMMGLCHYVFMCSLVGRWVFSFLTFLVSS